VSANKHLGIMTCAVLSSVIHWGRQCGMSRRQQKSVTWGWSFPSH